MKIKTSLLQEATNKVIKGAGFNNLLPLTTMLGVKASKGTLKFITKDVNTLLCVKVCEYDQDVDITIDAEKFSKLVNKLSGEMVDINITDDILELVCENSKYKFPIEVDENGKISMSNIKKVNGTEGSFGVDIIKSISNVNKATLPKEMYMPCLLNYYVDDTVISTDSAICTFNKKTLIDDTPRLFTSNIIELLTMFDETINYVYNESDFVFKSNGIILYAQLPNDELKDYPIDALKKFLNEQFSSKCRLPKAVLLAAIDRLSLFVDKYSNSAIKLKFNKDNVVLYTEENKETINYLEIEDFEEYECDLNIDLLKIQISSNPSDEIYVYFGNSRALKIEDEDVTQIISLLN